MKKQFAVINGAGNKLGQAFALRLAAREINLILISPPDSNLNTLVATCREHDIEVVCKNSDLNEHQHLDEVTEWINTNYDVALIVNNLTCLSSRSIIKKNKDSGMTEMTGELLTRALLANLQRQRRAYIVNVVAGRSQRIRHAANIQYDLRNTNVSFMVVRQDLLNRVFHLLLKMICLLRQRDIFCFTYSFAEISLQRLFKRKRNHESHKNGVRTTQTLVNAQD